MSFNRSNIDLQKKKMRLKTLICFLITCHMPVAYGMTKDRGTIGIDLIRTAAERKACIYFSHSFTTHWAIEASAAIPFPRPGKTEENIIHDMELGGLPSVIEDKGSESGMAIQFWPGDYGKGMFVSAGYLHGRVRTPDIIVTAGFQIRVIRSIGLCLGAGFRAIESSKRRQFCTESIRIGIHYIF